MGPVSRAGERGRALPAVVLGLLLVLASLPFGLRPAAAADPDQLVSITITGLTPSVVTARDPKTRATITGTITNTTDRPLVRVQAFFWRSLDPITDADGLDHALDSAATDPFGRRIDDPTSYDETWTSDQQELAPGKTVPFTVRATLAQLQLPDTDGVYLVGVHVREDRTTTIGRARLFLPVAVGAPTNPVKMASLVLLSSRPSLLAPGTPASDDLAAQPAMFADDHLATEVDDGGRLDQLLGDADQADSSFAVDPDLIASLQAMRDGYRVQSDEGAVTDGTGSAEAARWLQRFEQVSDRRDGYRLPYASIDLAALVHAKQPGVLTAAEQAAAQVSSVADLPLLALPSNGYADTATLTAIAPMSPAAYLLSDASTGGDGPLLTGPGGHPIVAYSASSTRGGPGPSPSTTPTHQRQAFLAASWIDQATARPGTSLGSVRVIAKPEDLSAGAGPPVADAPWLERTTLDGLLDGAPSPAPKLSYPKTAGEAELDPAQLVDVADLARLGNRYADLVTTSGAGTRAAATTARAASGAWRDQQERSHAVAARQVTDLRSALGTGVVISGGHRATLTSRDDQRFPLTVTNHLTVPVTVQLRFDGAFPQRLTVKSSELMTLQPGEARQVPNEAVARTNGTFPVTGQLYTKGGQRVGNPWDVQVSAADISRVGWLIVIGSGVTLVGATAFRIRQVARERRGAEQ
jgi:hypothetical protein